MKIEIVKETHPETGRIRYSIERDGTYVDGTLTTREDVASRMFEAVKKSSGATVWEREIIKGEELPGTNKPDDKE